MSTPKRYQFDNQLPVHRPVPLPEQYAAAPLDQQTPHQVIVQHFHQAPPDRTLQRTALGAGMGAGMAAAGVYFGPLLAAAFASMAITLAVAALVIAVSAWAVVKVVQSLAGQDGKGRKRRR